MNNSHHEQIIEELRNEIRYLRNELSDIREHLDVLYDTDRDLTQDYDVLVISLKEHLGEEFDKKYENTYKEENFHFFNLDNYLDEESSNMEDWKEE